MYKFIYIVLLFIIFGIALNISAAEFEGTFTGIVDNRESNSSVQLPQTIFGALGNAQLGTTDFLNLKSNQLLSNQILFLV